MANSDVYKSKTTFYVMACWILAAFGGLMFGYDIGISGGVSAMDDFLIKFFPKVHERKLTAIEDNYCKYDDQLLQLFTSSLYLAALVASFFASKLCTKLGRKPTILMASGFFLAGAGYSAGAETRWMLIIGRILFGFGVGFGNEAVPVFLSEIAPVQHRGAVNILFQLFVTIGIFIANLVNYATSMMHPNGWRVSLGLAAVPGLVLFFGSMILTETPASLVERGKDTEGKAALKRIRGVDDVDSEYEDVKRACEIAKQVKQPFKKLMKRSSRPPLIIAIVMQTSIGAILLVHLKATGGVTDMDDFLIKFFPKVHRRKLHAKENNYSKYDDQLLRLFTSSWYLAALVASFSASTACTILGRKLTILVASGFFLAGAGFSTGAEHKWMLILGRILFGIGVGLMGSADPISLYVSPLLLVWNRLMDDNYDGLMIQEMA
ncbi:sugar transporter 6 [Actinidia rufa]|uniref:Sugar transporter 6 n=1 Tax=Actinidia rufa TaxID=165716 RepID=A0A7J0EFB8_9ERIC|nr:sugar transporter 6 [Actinidia rufa]